MLQRIQTVYLTIAFLLSAVVPFIFPLWKEGGKDFYLMGNLIYVVLNGVSASLLVVSILSFKKRNHQFVLNRLSIIFNLILLGLFLYRLLNLSGETVLVFEKGIGMFMPILSVVLLVLANKAIKKDEDLVKSVDRLR